MKKTETKKTEKKKTEKKKTETKKPTVGAKKLLEPCFLNLFSK